MAQQRQTGRINPSGNSLLKFRADLVKHVHVLPVLDSLLKDDRLHIRPVEQALQHILLFVDVQVHYHCPGLLDSYFSHHIFPAIIHDNRHMVPF